MKLVDLGQPRVVVLESSNFVFKHLLFDVQFQNHSGELGVLVVFVLDPLDVLDFLFEFELELHHLNVGVGLGDFFWSATF